MLGGGGEKGIKATSYEGARRILSYTSGRVNQTVSGAHFWHFWHAGLGVRTGSRAAGWGRLAVGYNQPDKAYFCADDE